ncbi:MAG: hypothetical protein AAF684_06990, partial [Pseudomonadota bacterium]
MKQLSSANSAKVQGSNTTSGRGGAVAKRGGGGDAADGGDDAGAAGDGHPLGGAARSGVAAICGAPGRRGGACGEAMIGASATARARAG